MGLPRLLMVGPKIANSVLRFENFTVLSEKSTQHLLVHPYHGIMHATKI